MVSVAVRLLRRGPRRAPAARRAAHTAPGPARRWRTWRPTRGPGEGVGAGASARSAGARGAEMRPGAGARGRGRGRRGIKTHRRDAALLGRAERGRRVRRRGREGGGDGEALHRGGDSRCGRSGRGGETLERSALEYDETDPAQYHPLRARRARAARAGGARGGKIGVSRGSAAAAYAWGQGSARCSRRRGRRGPFRGGEAPRRGLES